MVERQAGWTIVTSIECLDDSAGLEMICEVDTFASDNPRWIAPVSASFHLQRLRYVYDNIGSGIAATDSLTLRTATDEIRSLPKMVTSQGG